MAQKLLFTLPKVAVGVREAYCQKALNNTSEAIHVDAKREKSFVWFVTLVDDSQKTRDSRTRPVLGVQMQGPSKKTPKRGL
jgi:hypothetical protein